MRAARAPVVLCGDGEAAMEPAGPGGGGAPPPLPEKKKKLNRAPSPARPKELSGWSLSKARRGSPVSLSVIPPGPRRPLPSPGTAKKPVVAPSRPSGGKGGKAGRGPRGTDSSSEGSCASEENSSSRGSSEGTSSRMQLSTSMAFSDLTEDILDGATEGLMREMEELRSENDYLKVRDRGGGAIGWWGVVRESAHVECHIVKSSNTEKPGGCHCWPNL